MLQGKCSDSAPADASCLQRNYRQISKNQADVKLYVNQPAIKVMDCFGLYCGMGKLS